MLFLQQFIYLTLIITTCVSVVRCATLLPYGPGNGDTEYVGVSDDSVITVPTSASYPIFGTSATALSITSNGNINLNDSTIREDTFPQYETIIAPLYDDITPRDGKLFYRETVDQLTLAAVALNVRQILGICTIPTTAFIVTWYNFSHYSPDDYHELTFQAVIITDGTETYAVFLYDMILGTETAFSFQAGVNVGDNLRYTRLCAYDKAGIALLSSMKQSLCQTETGIAAFRIDEWAPGPDCIPIYTGGSEVCGSDDGCTDPRCPVCNGDTSSCVECLSDTDCPGGFCDALVSQSCYCNTDGDCSDPRKPSCDNACRCHCASDDDCTDPEFPKCSPQTERCAGCLVDGHCKDFTRPRCEGEICRCIYNSDCSANRVCNAEGQCVCSSDYAPCDVLEGACNSDGICECSPNHTRDRFGKCIPDCDPQCTTGEVCVRNGTCVAVAAGPECQVDSDCIFGGEICGSDNKCTCPLGEKLLGECAKCGRLGGRCKNRRCFGRNLRCNVLTDTCECVGKCQATTVCLKRRRQL